MTSTSTQALSQLSEQLSGKGHQISSVFGTETGWVALFSRRQPNAKSARRSKLGAEA